MTVYVDASVWSFGRMTMCHMIASTPDELHAMADRIGVARRWYQGPGKRASFPHYDICKTKRAAAVAAGAVEVDRRQLNLAMREIRARIVADPTFAASWSNPGALRSAP